MSQHAQQMLQIFKGLHRAYGTYDLSRPKVKYNEGNKIVGKPKTVLGEVDEEIWDRHLDGVNGIGIVPIMDDSTCYFGAIDIDVYDGLDVRALLDNIHKQSLPLIACRTKSGGVHCYMFLKEPVPAAMMIEKLNMFAAILGFGKSEIFPKQAEILAERGDMGQWINMPYFNKNDTNRYAYNRGAGRMPIDEFILLAKKTAFSAADFKAFKVNLLSDISNGPPCLQTLITKGFTAGSRNDSLFNIAVYLKKANPDNWEGMVDDYNTRYFMPILSSNEVQLIIKSVARKEYNYTCEKSPLKDYCNIQLCRTRAYGVAEISNMPQLTGLTKFDSRPPVWFVDVEGGGRLELSTEEIQSQSKFQKRCMEALNQMPPPVKSSTWNSIIQNLMEHVHIIEAPIDASPKGMLFEYLEKFCTGRAQAREKDELLLGKPWSNEGKHFFRMIDFIAYLERNRFYEFKTHRISAAIQEVGGVHHFFKIKGKGVNAWAINEFASQDEQFNVPEIKDEQVF